MINILACASDNYTMQCGVLFCSICENNKIEPIHFYVFVDKDFTMDHKQQMEALINKYPQKQVSFITVLDDDVNRFLKLENSYYTRHVFYRLLMAKLLPLTVDRVLYLDCDIIVRKSLRPLWEIDISKKAIGVVRDAQEGVIYQYNRLGYSYDKGYFNSGVLYANLTYWRETNATERLFEYINFHADKIKLPDQDPLNVVFQDEKKFIPFTYNLQSDFLFKVDKMAFDYNKYKKELESCRENPVVLHLSGARPWINGCKHPFKSEFIKHRDKTFWKDTPLWIEKKSINVRLYQSVFLRKILSKLGVCNTIINPFDYSLKLK